MAFLKEKLKAKERSCSLRFLFNHNFRQQQLPIDLTLAMLLLRPHPLFSPEATQEKVWVTKERRCARVSSRLPRITSDIVICHLLVGDCYCLLMIRGIRISLLMRSIIRESHRITYISRLEHQSTHACERTPEYIDRVLEA
ncbi:hypothetical protein SADUNF_Sadunf07G0034200 [Salix dunnii]|uniref:Uncharacterized protein n=1 Tax=Salix dunnii TaxID=1413687 RepID=A0A835K2U9_9ROSI|nr:hypothetical protein SADUNF_Sadunf07G0034200 [Salix dunnii]